MEEIALSEWSERMDIAGSNHWLPAYGFQQPTQLQQALLQQQDRDADLVDNGTFRLLKCSCIPECRPQFWRELLAGL
jgi:hypothetical protein